MSHKVILLENLVGMALNKFNAMEESMCLFMKQFEALNITNRQESFVDGAASPLESKKNLLKRLNELGFFFCNFDKSFDLKHFKSGFSLANLFSFVVKQVQNRSFS